MIAVRDGGLAFKSLNLTDLGPLVVGKLES